MTKKGKSLRLLKIIFNLVLLTLGGTAQASPPGESVSYITTDDGAQVALTHFPTPVNVSGRPPIILLPACFNNRNIYKMSSQFGLAYYLQAHNFDTWILEWRGSSLSGPLPWDSSNEASWSFDDFIHSDLVAAVEHVRTNAGTDQVFLLGTAAGANVGIGFLETEQADHVAGMVVIAPGILLGATEGRCENMPMQRVFNYGAEIQSNIPADVKFEPIEFMFVFGSVLLAACFDDPGACLEDNWHDVFWNTDNMDFIRTGLFYSLCIRDVSSNELKQGWEGAGYLDNHGLTTFPGSAWEQQHGYFNYFEHLDDIDNPILFISGSSDLLVPSEIAQEVYSAIGSSDKIYREFGVSSGDSVDYGHLDLVIGCNAPFEVFPEIATWLQEH
jgi:lysosomal acid lipase/cholesteryl ester hydrolase